VTGADLSSFTGLEPRPAWFDHARCREPAWRDTFHELMSLTPSRSVRRMRLVSFARWGCATCPVQPHCRAWALGELSVSQDRLLGVIAGSTVQELRQEVKAARAG